MHQTHHRMHSAMLPALKQLCAPTHANEVSEWDDTLDLRGVSMSCTHFAKLLDAVDVKRPGKHVGLDLAAHFPLGDTGVFGLALMNAPSFRHAIEFFVTFLPLVADHSSFHLSLGANDAFMEWHYSPFLEQRNNYIDFCIALSLRQFSQFHEAGWKPKSVSLQRATDSGSKNHLHFSNTVKLDCESHVMEFSQASLRSTKADADHRIFDALTEVCDTHLAAKKKSIMLEDRARDFILSGLATDRPTLQSVSQHLGVEPRTLQRKLHSLGLDFSSLVDGVRHEYSDFLLAETTASIAEIGNKLGYSSSASYARAAQAWYGMSASSKRETLH